MTLSGKITVSVSSRVAHVDLIHAISDQVATLVGFDGDEVLNLGLAVREAAINAIKHGNGLDPKKRVRVVFQFDEDGMSIAIRDRGKGFDLDAIADPTLPENLFQASGRGVLLMKAFVDRVEVHGEEGKGSEVFLFKMRHPRSSTGSRMSSEPQAGREPRRSGQGGRD